MQKNNFEPVVNRVGIYVRVSSKEQAEEGYSIGEQTERLENYCKARDWRIFKVYTDPGFSGAKMNRPALRQLIHDVEHNQIDVVLVYKLDRLSRSQKDTLYLIEDVFNKNQVGFVSMQENFDTSTAFGRAMIGILSVFAQLEREQIKERTAMGRDARAKEGYFHGGGYAPIGYDYINGELIINEYEAMQIQEIYQLFLDGWSIYRIFKHIHSKYTTKYGAWRSDSAIHSVLKTPLYKGIISWRGQFYQGRHKAIVPTEVYDMAQARYAEIKWTPGKAGRQVAPYQRTQLLGGLLFCKHCGARYYTKGNYTGHPGGKQHYRPYYTCYSRGKPSKHMIKDPNCKNKSWYVGALNEIVINEIKKLISDECYFAELTTPKTSIDHKQPSNIQIIKNQLEEISKQTNRLLDLCQTGAMPIDTISKRLNSLQAERLNLEKALEEYQNDIPSPLPAEDALEILNDFDSVFTNGSLEDQQAFLASLIDSIEIDGDNLFIKWKFAL